jgi:integrase
MPGSYTWLKNGKCQLFVSNGTGLGGKRDRRTKVVSAKDDEEAEKLLALFYADVVRGKIKDGSNMKFKDYIDLWIKNYVEKELEPKTIDSYKSELKKRIVPALGHIKLRELKPLHLLDFYDNLQEDGIRQDKRKGGLSNKTISYYHRIISSALQTAVMWNLLDENPAQRVKPPKVKKKEAKFYDKEQAIELLNVLANEPLKYQVAVLLDITTALRRGELLGLDWTDLNTETTRIVNVNKSSQYIPGKGIFTKDPKNESSVRKGIIPKFIIPVILAYKKEQEIQRNELGDKWISKIEVMVKLLIITMLLKIQMMYCWMEKADLLNGTFWRVKY